MRSLVRVIPTIRDVLKIPNQISHVKTNWVSETETKSSTSMHFGETSISINTLAGLLYVSEELMADSAVNLMQLIVEDFANAIGAEEDRVIVIGSGTGQPTGIASCTIGSRTCSNPLTADDIINTYYDLPAQYSNRATWVMNTRTLRAIMTLKDTTNRYLVNDGIMGQNRAQIYGRPVVENNNLPSTSLYFGDWSYYILADRQQIAVKTTTEGAGTFEKDEIAIRVTERIGGKCSDGVGFKKLTTIPVS